MRPRLFAVAALLVVLSACGLVPLDGAEPSTETADTGVMDGECRLEGEACIQYEDGTSNCCIRRHTCFPEGCHY